MARKPRFDLPDFLYHVTARGNNRRIIFLEEIDYLRYIHLLFKNKQKYRFSLYAFVLMPNHVHLLIRPSRGGRLSKVMQAINTGYTMYFNRKYGRCGHLFQGRYYSLLVEEEAHFLELLRYIHQNPVRAKLVERVKDYHYSSFPYYINEGKQNLIDKEEVLNMFSLRKETGIRRFKTFVEHVKTKGSYDPKKFIRSQRVLGSEEFEKMILKVLVDRAGEV